MREMPKILEGKNFLLCVSGGIAVYKALELVRFFKKRGGNVKVAMSENAQKFVSSLSFETLSGNPVLLDGNEQWANGVDHISYASWADVCLLVPATINSLSKFAYGMADNVMLSTLLASKARKIIAPAANTQMYLSPQAQDSIQRLKEMGCIVIEPREDLLACGVRGIGALQEIEEIAYVAAREVLKHPFWCGKRVIVSGGGSSEEIDEVRCITNYSSGIQASFFALALYLLGAELVFVSSQKPFFLPLGILSYRVKSVQDFYSVISQEAKNADFYFGIAALSDFRPKIKRAGKIKKEEGLKVEFEKNLDVLLELKGVSKVGFKAEKDRDKALIYAQKMLEQKDCDFVCLNVLEEENDFGSEKNRITLLSKNGEVIDLGMQDKFCLAFRVLEIIAND